MTQVKIVPMGDKQYKAMTKSLVMPYAKSERKRQIVAQRYAYGINEESTPVRLPKAKNLSRRVRIGKYMGLNNIEALVKPAPAPVVAKVEEPAKSVRSAQVYQKYVFRDRITGKVLNYASAGNLPHSYR